MRNDKGSYGETSYISSIELEIERDYRITTIQFAVLTFLFFGVATFIAPLFGYWANVQGRRYGFGGLKRP